MGSGHTVCEDYALAGSNYIIVSDGCSSAPFSDVGARLIAHQAARIIENGNPKQLLTYEEFGKQVIYPTKVYTEAMGLPTSCLDATLVVAFAIGTMLHIRIYGDGVFQVNAKDGKETTIISYPQERPYYLSYLLSNNIEKFVEKQATKKIYTIGETFEHTKHVLSTSNLQFGYKLEDVKSVLIASDGVTTFYNSMGEYLEDGLPVIPILEELTNFKTVTKGFVTRRLKRASANFAKKGIKHNDDISMGVMIC